MCGCSKSQTHDNTTTSTPPDPTVEPATKAAASDDPALRRAYVAADMSYHACTKVEDDGTIHGEQCPRGFAVFGPYVSVPDESDVEVTFEIEASSETGVYSDLASNVGQRIHGALMEQTVHAKERRKLGYRVHFFTGATKLEARIAVYPESTVDFRIYNLSVVVR